MSPEPFIAIDITLNDRQIDFEPSLQETAAALNNIYHDLIKSLTIFPRLNEKFELPPTPEIKKFSVVVSEDKDCRKMLNNITDVIEHTFEKTGDYIYAWQHFRSIWDIDIDRFMVKYQNRGLELKEFESAMLKYFDVANQVQMQDTIVTINYLTFNCSRLKDHVLDYIADWKKSYKLSLCTATLKKLEKLNAKLTTRIKNLNEQPTCFEELDAAIKLYELSMKQLKDREADMAEIKEFYSYLGKFSLLKR